MSDKPSIRKVNDWNALGHWFRSRWIGILAWLIFFSFVHIPIRLTIPTTEITKDSIPLPFILAMVFFAVGCFVLFGLGFPVLLALKRCAGLKKT